jgi:hypothetical protein
MRPIAMALVFSIIALGGRDAFAQAEATAWREVAQTIPLGTKVKLQTLNGNRLNGTLMRVDADGIMLKRNTRRPEPAETVAFIDISRLERDQGGNGSSILKAAGVGLAVGAGIFISMVLIALQLD